MKRQSAQQSSAAISKYFDELVETHGYGSRALDASSQDSLDVRYRVLAGVMDLSNRSILDVGCGFGDLGEYLMKKFDGITYTGIDLSLRMIEEARVRHPKWSFEHGNVMDLSDASQFDVVLASGIFYLLGENAEKKMHEIIQKMWNIARQAVAFTAISTWHPHKTESEYYVDPVRLLDWARMLTPYLTIRHDYHHGDCTLYLYRTIQ